MYGFFIKPASEVTHYEGCIVDAATGLIVQRDGAPCLEQSDEILHWHPDPMRRTIRDGSSVEVEFQRRKKMLGLLASSLHKARGRLAALDPEVNYVSVLSPFGWYPYGHFFDSVQRLFPLMGAVPEPWVVLHSDPRRVHDFSLHMEYLGVDKGRLMCLAEPAVVPNLWVSPWQAPPAELYPPAYNWIFDAYTSKIASAERTLLYLSRNHVRPGQRSVLNESEIRERLEPLGFTFVTGNEPLPELVALFHNARFVTGAHGSLFANTIFCRKDCRIVEFCSLGRPDFSFYRKNKNALDYRHRLVYGDADDNIYIPVSEVIEQLS